MNPRMWEHPATQRNLAILEGATASRVVGPNDGAMAERRERAGPHGGAARDRRRRRGAARRRGAPLRAAREAARPRPARRQACPRHLRADARADRSGALHRQPLVGQAGPCHRAGGGGGRRQGHAGVRARSPSPTRPASRSSQSRPPRDMLEAVEAALPADIAIFAAAVADWRVAAPARREDQEERRRCAGPGADRESRHPGHASRTAPPAGPRLVVGFAAETENVDRERAQPSSPGRAAT